MYWEHTTQSGDHFSLTNLYRNGSNVDGIKDILNKH